MTSQFLEEPQPHSLPSLPIHHPTNRSGQEGFKKKKGMLILGTQDHPTAMDSSFTKCFP